MSSAPLSTANGIRRPRPLPRPEALGKQVLRREAASGALDVPVDLHELAYVIVRLIESYSYLDLISGEQPDARRAEPILRMLAALTRGSAPGSSRPEVRARKSGVHVVSPTR